MTVSLISLLLLGVLYITDPSSNSVPFKGLGLACMSCCIYLAFTVPSFNMHEIRPLLLCQLAHLSQNVCKTWTTMFLAVLSPIFYMEFNYLQASIQEWESFSK